MNSTAFVVTAFVVQRVYLDTLAGRIPPDQGHMLSLLR